MLTARPHLSNRTAALFLALLAFFAALCLIPGLLEAQQPPETLPLTQVRPGMQGYAYTIFAGDQIEKFDLEVIGVVDNFLGPKQSIILVQLKGPKVEHTGVVAGMSGSPVYLEGKLAGALSLKLGVFTKEPIAGVTPIADVLAGGVTSDGNHTTGAVSTSAETLITNSVAGGVSNELASSAGLRGGAEVHSIETPLIFSGFQP